MIVFFDYLHTSALFNPSLLGQFVFVFSPGGIMSSLFISVSMIPAQLKFYRTIELNDPSLN